MLSYTIRRLLLVIPTVFFALSFLFLLFFALPGDPANLIAGGGDRNPDPIVIQQVEERYGLDDPLIIQFKDYWVRTLHWDLGESFSDRQSVNEILGEKAVNSLRLAFWAILIEIVVGISVGVLSAVRRYSLADKLTTVGTAALSAVPVFVLGFILQYVFAVVPEQTGLARLDQAPDLGARPGHLDPLLHPHRRAVALPDPACGHPRLRVHRAGRPHDPGLHARGAAGRLHAHRPGQGPRRAPGHLRPRPAQRHAAR